MREDLEVIYWILLAETLGYGSSKVKKVAEIFESSKTFYDSGIDSWKQSNLFNEKELVRLKNKYFLEKAKNIFSECSQKGYKILSYNSLDYPKRLKNIDNPPAVLYICGNLPKVDDEVLIGIVGTRKPTEYGKNVAFNFGYSLAKHNVTVVSGGALGVDSFAQNGAIQSGGKVISVLGCGFNCKYLVTNEKLRESTKKNGALVSEYPPDTPAIPRNFPIRNRIISGLSLGIVVVEAGKKSGALITSNMAKKQGRDIFSIPGNIDSEYSFGTNHLIKNGAKLVVSVEDILKEYDCSPILKSKEEIGKVSENISLFGASSLENATFDIPPHPKENIKTEGETPKFSLSLKNLNNASKEALKVYECLSAFPISTESIVLKTKMSLSQVFSCLTELEILDLVKSLPGGKYQKV